MDNVEKIEQLLIDIAQVLDAVKVEWSTDGSWSEFDQSCRDRITEWLQARAALAAMEPGGERESAIRECAAKARDVAFEIMIECEPGKGPGTIEDAILSLLGPSPTPAPEGTNPMPHATLYVKTIEGFREASDNEIAAARPVLVSPEGVEMLIERLYTLAVACDAFLAPRDVETCREAATALRAINARC